MALAASVPTAFGIDAAYWRIAKATYDRAADTVLVDLYGYAGPEAAVPAAAPLDSLCLVAIPCAALGLTPGGALALAPLYDAVKAAADAAPDGPLRKLAGAEDC